MDKTNETALSYRLLVTRRNASEILLIPDKSGWLMPKLEIHPEGRIAEQLTEKTSATWGLRAYCLFVPKLLDLNRSELAKCAVLDSVFQNGKPPDGTVWLSRRTVQASLESTEAALIRGSLDELDSYVTSRRSGPFARPGWLKELCSWVEDALRPSHRRLTGQFRQLNASPTFSLIRLETNCGGVWFKAAGVPNSHEQRVTTRLAQLFPGSVPQLLGVHKGWNGWLSEEVAGSALGEVQEISRWEQTARELAELQIASIGRVADLLEAGMKDLRYPTLLKQIDPFLDRMKQFMAMQEKPAPQPLVASELSTLADALKACCKLMQDLRFPATLGHIDLNPGNILISQDRSVFLDWAEGCIGEPMLTFEYLREHMKRQIGAQAAERLAGAYLNPWASLYSPADLGRALALVRPLAVLAYAVTNDSWSSVDAARNPVLAGYFRSLTRRMHREAIYVLEKGSSYA